VATVPGLAHPANGARTSWLPWVVAAAIVAVAAALPSAAAGAVPLAQVGGFAAPVYVTAPPGDTHRAFVVERKGTIRVIKDGLTLGTPFLDITGLVEAGYQEQGLLGLAFSPDYATSGRFYVYYTARPSAVTNDGDIVIDEFQRSAANPDVADPTTRRTVLTIDHAQKNFHNGGTIEFGPDGYLYVGTGDGGTGGGNARSTQSLLGKILRIDPRPGVSLTPPGNPFGNPVWAYGLRNPYRWSFDKATGDLVIGDVGESCYEEVDFVAKSLGLGRGADFGWNLLEGTHVYGGSPGAPCGAPATQFPPGYVGPVIEKSHATDGWCALIGGPMVRDPALPTLYGRYLYGDFCKPELWSATLSPSGAAGNAKLQDLPVSTTGFGEDGCGRVYVTSFGAGGPSGTNEPVYRLGNGTCAGPAPTFPGPPGSGVPGSPGVGPPGPGAPGAAPAGPGATAAGTSAPARRLILTLHAAARQRALRRGYLAVLARCDEQCTVAAHAILRMRARGRRANELLRTKAVKRTLAQSASVVLHVPLSAPARRTLRGVLARGGRATAALTVTARDPRRNERVSSVLVRIVG
jgi:glucose/arabinose dehydrogenase